MRGSANVSGRRSTTQMKRSVLISHEEKVYWYAMRDLGGADRRD